MFSFSLRRSLALVLCFSIMALASVGLAQEQQAEWMEIVRAAEQLAQQGQPEQARAELQKVFSQTDQFAPAYFVAGMVHASTGDMAKAYENMVQATVHDPSMGMAHRMASQGAGAMGNFDASWEHAIKAHQAGTDMADAFAALSSMAEAPAGLAVAARARACRKRLVFSTSFPATIFAGSTSHFSPSLSSTALTILLRYASFAGLSLMFSADSSSSSKTPSAAKPVSLITDVTTACMNANGGR